MMVPKIVNGRCLKSDQAAMFDSYIACGLCGRELESSYSFCPGCGEKIDWRRNGRELLPQEDETDPLFP